MTAELSESCMGEKDYEAKEGLNATVHWAQSDLPLVSFVAAAAETSVSSTVAHSLPRYIPVLLNPQSSAN